RWRLWLVLVLLLLVAGLALVPQVRWPIYGWFRGEAFYQGMPTSWWAQEIRESYRPVAVAEAIAVVVEGGPAANEMTAAEPGPTEWWRERPSSTWDRVTQWIDFS